MDQHDGDVVRILLGKKRMTQVDFAERMGMNRSTLGRLLDKADWNAKQLAQAGRILGVNLFAHYSEVSGMVRGLLILQEPDGTSSRSFLISEPPPDGSLTLLTQLIESED